MATAPRGSFSSANRHMQEEETLPLTSVGVDIGSSTSHLVFSRLELTLEGSRYRVTKRDVLNESDILLTPYVDDTRIDVRRQYNVRLVQHVALCDAITRTFE